MASAEVMAISEGKIKNEYSEEDKCGEENKYHEIKNHKLDEKYDKRLKEVEAKFEATVILLEKFKRFASEVTEEDVEEYDKLGHNKFLRARLDQHIVCKRYNDYGKGYIKFLSLANSRPDHYFLELDCSEFCGDFKMFCEAIDLATDLAENERKESEIKKNRA